MSTKDPIYCFNGNPAEDKGECIYKECPMYSETIDTCRLELLKGAAPVAPPQRRQTPPDSPTPTQEGEYKFINTLKEGDQSSKDNKINVKGTLVNDPIQVERNTQYGPNDVTNFTIEDETGQLKLGIWGRDGDQFMDFVKGDKIFIENVYKIKAPYEDVLQADVGKYFKVAKVN